MTSSRDDARRTPPGDGSELAELSRDDRAVIRAFGDWLEGRPVIVAPTVGDEVRMLRSVLTVVRTADLDPHDPVQVVAIVDAIEDLDDAGEYDAVDQALSTLAEYLHFRAETEPGAGWGEAFDEVADLVDSRMVDPLGEAIEGGEQVDPAVRRAALSRLRVVTAVRPLLEWLGSARTVTETGALRPTDIAPVAALLGLDAAAPSSSALTDAADAPASSAPELPVTPDSSSLESPVTPGSSPSGLPGAPVPSASGSPGADAASSADAAPDPSVAPDAPRPVRSMSDLPELAAWWQALAAAEIVDIGEGRAQPGAAAVDWVEASTPPLESAEMVAGLTLGDLLYRDEPGDAAVEMGGGGHGARRTADRARHAGRRARPR
ncbi:hypothetical protein [Microbacterium luticocti]|uniref:hypothetical protein n=1 Tax=Microbacterium luticocti TaxID=451764 RepID=UPI0004272C56|nr:hypothetical protein [Microbacterium luticocti]